MICPYCQVEFIQNRDWQRFCSKEHQKAWHRHQNKLWEVQAEEFKRARRLGLVAPVEEVEEEPEPVKLFVRRV
jgi:hypothetical protein